MKIFCMANGPSMSWQSFGDSKEKREKYQPYATGLDMTRRLREEIVIGVNWVSLLYDPDYLVFTDSLEYFKGKPGGYKPIQESKAQIFGWDHQRNAPVDIDIRRFSFFSTKEDIILSEYVDDGLMRNGSCIYSAVNLAYIMGASKIFLVGTDFSARQLDPEDESKGSLLHFYDEEPADMSFAESRAPVDRGTLDYFERLGAHASKFNIEIWNATEGGILQNFPKCTLEEALDMEDPEGDNILYTPSFDNLPAEYVQMRKIHEANKRELRLEVQALWRKKKGLS